MPKRAKTNAGMKTLEPGEIRLVRRFRTAVLSHPRLSAVERLFCLLHRHEDRLARRRLIRHYLPTAFKLAMKTEGGDLIRRIEIANHAVVECIDRDVLRPADDLDHMVETRILETLRNLA